MKKDFAGQQLSFTDFSSQNLSGADFSGAVLVKCNFDNSDLSHANFEKANCAGASFRQTRLYYTNFKDANLQLSIQEPRDIFGTTLTLNCLTFDQMQMNTNGVIVVLYFLLLAKLPDSIREKLKKLIIDEVGEAKFTTLERAFAHRRL